MKMSVTDDSGFLALVDPDAITMQLGDDWTFEEMKAQLVGAMARRQLLIWGTGMEKNWPVEVLLQGQAAPGFRQTQGTIHCSGGRLLVPTYESLSMNVPLPESFEMDQLIHIPAGNYLVRIVQTDDPSGEWKAESGFCLQISPSPTALPAWPDIPWFEG